MADIDTSYVQFRNDDAGYLRWLEANPNGFVVNSSTNPRPNYLILHRASCKHISSANWSNWTTGDFIKTCSPNIDPLSRWARQDVGGELQPCGMCKPELVRGTGAPPAAPELVPQPHSVIEPALKAQGTRQVPKTVSTGCPELDLVWSKFVQQILESTILIADTEDDVNWHSFLGHSLDMQGFRAAEFVGVDALTREIQFTPLKARGIGIRELAQLWEIDAIRDHLLNKKGTVSEAFDVLETHGGSVGKSLADAFRQFKRCRFPSTVRAILQNSAVLKDYGYSFRNWLRDQCEKLGFRAFPPTDFRAKTNLGSMSLEMALRHRLQETFYQVGSALAPYMICDWQLWLWNNGRTEVFANFKLDSFHEEFVKRFGRGLIPKDEHGFADWWLSIYPDLPPRLANECIWLGLEHKVV